MKTKDHLTKPVLNNKKQSETDIRTVQVRINHKKHTCPMCCLEFCNFSSSHPQEEFTNGSVYNNGSIIPVKPITCDCCGLKVVS